MTTDDFVITKLAESNPVCESTPPSPQERAEAERILRRVLAEPARRRRPRARPGVLAPVVSVLVVLVVVAVVLRTGSGSTPSGSAPGGGTTITLSARPTPQVPRITASAMS